MLILMQMRIYIVYKVGFSGCHHDLKKKKKSDGAIALDFFIGRV